MVPKPGAHIRILIGEPMLMPMGMDEHEVETSRLELQTRLLALQVDLDARTGFTDSEPLQYMPAA